MDEELLKAARLYFEQMALARRAGDKPTATERENYARSLTNGQHGYADMEALRDEMGNDPVSSALRGFTANFADELVGMLPKALGGGAAGREEQRLRQDLYEQEHPKTDIALQAAGGVGAALALPLGKLAEGASLGQKMISGAKVGAALGAANGAGGGEDTMSRLEGAGIGGVGGAVLGAAIPRVLGSRPAAALGRRIASAAGEAMTPLEESFAKLGGVRVQLEKAIEGLGGFRAAHAANDALEAGGRGEIATLADLGKPMTDLADFAATNSSKAATQIGDVADARAAGTTSRVLNDFKAGAGDVSAEARVAQLAAETRAWANSDAAYGTRANGLGLHGNNPMVPLGDAEPLVTQPRIKNIFANAKNTSMIGPDASDFTTQAMNEARAANPELDKFMAANPKLNVQALLNDPDATAQLEAMGKGHLLTALKSADGKAPFDVVQDLQQSLQDAADHAFAKQQNNLGFRLKDSADLVQRTLEETIPGYADIVDQYAARKGMERAVELGQDWFHKKADIAGLRRVVESLKDKPLLMEEFRKGLASEQIIALQRQTGENAATKLMIAKNNLPQQQMNEIVFGDRATYDRFMQQAKAERALGYLSGAGKGSQTAGRAMRNAQALGTMGDVAHELVNNKPSLLHVAKAKLVHGTIGSMLEKRADELTPLLLTRGHSSIDELLNVLERTSARARVDATASRLAPGAESSLFGQRSQD